MEDIPSPCAGLCKLIEFDQEKVCEGCGRKIEEIANWATLDCESRYNALLHANRRLLLIIASNGGHND